MTLISELYVIYFSRAFFFPSNRTVSLFAVSVQLWGRAVPAPVPLELGMGSGAALRVALWDPRSREDRAAGGAESGVCAGWVGRAAVRRVVQSHCSGAAVALWVPVELQPWDDLQGLGVSHWANPAVVG